MKVGGTCSDLGKRISTEEEFCPQHVSKLGRHRLRPPSRKIGIAGRQDRRNAARADLRGFRSVSLRGEAKSVCKNSR